MKTLILFILFAGFVFSQSTYKTITYQVDAAASDSFKFNSGYTFSGIFMPTTISDSIRFDVSRGDAVWYRLTDNDGVEYVQTALTTKANAVPLKALYFYPWTYFRIIVTDTAGHLPFTATAVGVKYLP